MIRNTLQYTTVCSYNLVIFVTFILLQTSGGILVLKDGEVDSRSKF